MSLTGPNNITKHRLSYIEEFNSKVCAERAN